MLIEIAWRTRVDEKNFGVLRLEFRGMIDKVMDLLHTIGALIAGKSPQYHENKGVSALYPCHADSTARRGRKCEVGSFCAYFGSLRERGRSHRYRTNDREHKSCRFTEWMSGKRMDLVKFETWHFHAETLLVWM